MSMDNFFSCEPYMPISRYVKAQSAYVELEVDDLVLAYIQSIKKTVKIAVRTDGAIQYVAAKADGQTNRVCSMAPVTPGASCVAISDAFISGLPVITHWDASKNDGAGSYFYGATDGIGLLDIQIPEGTIVREFNIYDMDPQNPYTYTRQYNLFSSSEFDGNSGSNLLPDYERYIGASYSLFGVSNRLALWRAAETVEGTGFPLVYLTPEDTPHMDAPVFQVICNRIIQARGTSPSLAYFILPPFWSPIPKQPYPILFSGFYDSNENFFSTFGPSYIKTLAKGYHENGHSAIAVLWNGGGTSACFTMQPGALRNLGELFAVCERDYAGNRHNIIAAGASRGGISALMAAGNPLEENYTVRYAVAYNPVIYMGEKISDILSPTTPLMFSVVTEATGYKQAWRDEWTDPRHQLSGVELTLNNLTGTRYQSLANQMLLPFSPVFGAQMKRRGTQILLSVGTHDGFATKDPIIELAERLRSQGVPLHLQIGYRFGHGDPDNLMDRAEELLLAVLRGESPTLSGVSHYMRIDGAPGETPVSKQFYPEHFPVFFEGPKMLAMHKEAKLNVVGPEGTSIRVIAVRMEEASMDMSTVDNNQIVLMEGVLPAMSKLDGHPSFLRATLLCDERFTLGTYIYKCTFRLPGEADWHELPAENIASLKGEKIPTLQILDSYPAASGMEISTLLSDGSSVSWGLSEV